MEAAAVAAPTDVQPTIEQPAAPVVVEAPKELTIKEHAAATREPEKRRRDVDMASPEEREEIGTLTKRLRDAEEASGIKRKPNESNRVYDLRMRAELAERLRDASKPAVEKPTPRPAAQVMRAPSVPDFTEKEPTLDQFKDEADPATAYFKALARFENKRTQHEDMVAAAENVTKEHDTAARNWWVQRGTEHVTRLEKYLKENPTSTVTGADGKQTTVSTRSRLEAIGDKPLSPILFGAIQIHPESHKLMMALADHPELHDELFLLTDGKPVGDPTRNPLIGIVQRRLLTKAQTGKVPERSPKSEWKPPAPPPSPVRTQPTAIAQPASDEEKTGSIMSHARKYYAKD